MRTYLAAPFNRKAEVRLIRELLQKENPNIQIVGRWIDNSHTSDNVPIEVLVREAHNDIDDINSAGMFILLNLPQWKSTSGGMFTEFGIAFASGKFMVVIGSKSQVFHYHESIHWFPTLENFLAWFAKGFPNG